MMCFEGSCGSTTSTSPSTTLALSSSVMTAGGTNVTGALTIPNTVLATNKVIVGGSTGIISEKRRPQTSQNTKPSGTTNQTYLGSISGAPASLDITAMVDETGLSRLIEP